MHSLNKKCGKHFEKSMILKASKKKTCIIPKSEVVWWKPPWREKTALYQNKSLIIEKPLNEFIIKMVHSQRLHCQWTVERFQVSHPIWGVLALKVALATSK